MASYELEGGEVVNLQSYINVQPDLCIETDIGNSVMSIYFTKTDVKEMLKLFDKKEKE